MEATVVTILAKHLFSIFGDDAQECFTVGYEHYLRSLGLALCMVRPPSPTPPPTYAGYSCATKTRLRRRNMTCFHATSSS